MASSCGRDAYPGSDWRQPFSHGEFVTAISTRLASPSEDDHMDDRIEKANAATPPPPSSSQASRAHADISYSVQRA